MERLTKRDGEDNKNAFCPSDVKCCGRCSVCDHMDKMMEKLADYEDAEENGMLLRPKCRLGNIVYALWSIPTEARYVIYPAEVKEISLSSTNTRKMIMYKLEPIYFRGRYNTYYDDDFGKLVFLTEAEAEQALAKMEGV